MKCTLKMTMTAAAALMLSAAAALAQIPASWKDIPKPQLHQFKVEKPQRIELSNGMVIFLMEDHELPLVRGTAVIRGGSRDEPGVKAGLSGIYAQVWRTGGTKTKTGDQLDDELEMRAAKVETNGDLDSTAISFDCLKTDVDAVYPVWLDLLRNPEFREEKITLAKNQINTGIARRNDDPAGIASREASRLAYGIDSPYGRIAEYATVNSVKRDDLVAWHNRFVHPNNMVVGVVGDFDAKAMERRLRAAFGALPRGPQAQIPEVAFTGPKPGIYFIQKDDVNQSNIRMVAVGARRDSPDYHALEVMNEAFGGGFSARLFSNIRSKKGLAYNVGGGVGSEYDHPGLMRLSMGTKSGSTSAAIDALYTEVEDLNRTPFTTAELQRAKESILNSYIFRLDSKSKILREQMNLQLYGYPSDFFDKYRGNIEKVAPEDVARVAKQYVQKDKLAVVVVGKASDFDKPLASFGPVTTLDITIPEGAPAAAKAATPAVSDDAGKALAAKVVESFGGAARLQSIRSLRRKSSAQLKTPQGEMNAEIDATEVYPDRIARTMTMPMGEMKMIITPEFAVMSMGAMGTRDLPASQKESMLKEMKRSPLYVARNISDPSYRFTAGGSETINGVAARMLTVQAEGGEQIWYVDPSTGRILRTVSRSMEMGSPAEMVSDYSDFKELGGLMVATKQTLTRNGESAGQMQLKELIVNPPVEEKMFVKP